MKRLLTIAACLLQACLFQTHRPRSATLILTEGQAAFDPLIVISMDPEGNILDTLFRGPGAPGAFRIPADGLSDSSQIRLEGYAGGRLAYRLDFPAHGEDTLIAAPRWTPVGSLGDWPQPRTVSLAFPDGRPAFSYVGLQVTATRMATFDSARWAELGLPSNQYEDQALAADGTGLYLVSTERLGLWKWNGTDWTLLFEDPASAVRDVRFALDEGVLTFVLGRIGEVVVERYQADSGWRRTERMVFPGHSLPGMRSPVSSNLAMDGGEPAILMTSPSFEEVVYRRRAGVWDTLPVGRSLLWPALAREGDDLFLAFADRPGSGTPLEDYPITAWRSEGRGWRSLGANIFTSPGSECRIEVHDGRPVVLARVGHLPLVVRLTEAGWKTLVAPRFSVFPYLYDFVLDGTGVPHLAVFGSEFQIVKFIDPYQP